MKGSVLISVSVLLLTGCAAPPPVRHARVTASSPQPAPQPASDSHVTYKISKIAPSERRRVEQTVQANLRDPDSAKFSGLYVRQGSGTPRAYCGYVNSKNGYGGYAGKTKFSISSHEPDKVWFADGSVGDIVVRTMCRSSR